MNDRGKPLSPVDMLKAYLLAPIQDERERSDANRVWKKTVLDLISWGGEPDMSAMLPSSRHGCAPSTPTRSGIVAPGATDQVTGNSLARYSIDGCGTTPNVSAREMWSGTGR